MLKKLLIAPALFLGLAAAAQSGQDYEILVLHQSFCHQIKASYSSPTVAENYMWATFYKEANLKNWTLSNGTKFTDFNCNTTNDSILNDALGQAVTHLETTYGQFIEETCSDAMHEYHLQGTHMDPKLRNWCRERDAWDETFAGNNNLSYQPTAPTDGIIKPNLPTAPTDSIILQPLPSTATSKIKPQPLPNAPAGSIKPNLPNAPAGKIKPQPLSNTATSKVKPNQPTTPTDGIILPNLPTAPTDHLFPQINNNS